MDPKKLVAASLLFIALLAKGLRRRVALLNLLDSLGDIAGKITRMTYFGIGNFRFLYNNGRRLGYGFTLFWARFVRVFDGWARSARTAEYRLIVRFEGRRCTNAWFLGIQVEGTRAEWISHGGMGNNSGAVSTVRSVTTLGQGVSRHKT